MDHAKEKRIFEEVLAEAKRPYAIPELDPIVAGLRKVESDMDDLAHRKAKEYPILEKWARKQLSIITRMLKEAEENAF